jgi:adenylyl-sulfate kinase
MRGVTVWLTGLPGSGKSTVARHLARQLAHRGVSAEVLDGDQVRASLSKGLGFTRADRDDNVSRIGFVCNLLTRNGVVAIAAVVSPYAAARDAVRAQIGDFLEVHVATPLEHCERRDTRGRYAAARRGEIANFTGVDDPYEAPVKAELVLDCAAEPPELCAARVLALLEERGYVGSVEGTEESTGENEGLENALKQLGYA